MRDAAASVVRVLGTACGLGIEGSGWVAAPGYVVTNAHVVAGESDTVVQVGGSPPGLPAQPVVFDPHDDIAVLRVPGLDEPSLPIAALRAGRQSGRDPRVPAGRAVRRASRAGSAQTQPTHTEDAYGDGPVTRLITSLRGLVRPGNSGGPMVDRGGPGGRDGVRGDHRGSGRAAGGYAVANAVVRTELAAAERRRRTAGLGSLRGVEQLGEPVSAGLAIGATLRPTAWQRHS